MKSGLIAIVESNSVILKFINQHSSNKKYSTYIGTLDYAVARLHNSIIKVNDLPLFVAEQYYSSIHDIKRIVNEFYKYTKLLVNSGFIMSLYYKYQLHRIGTKKIPKIKTLLQNIIINSNND
tara:strand:+ start:652 stop:1017 length:366 start_codon:yes stop_codon:yes gene_type:complete